MTHEYQHQVPPLTTTPWTNIQLCRILPDPQAWLLWPGLKCPCCLLQLLPNSSQDTKAQKVWPCSPTWIWDRQESEVCIALGFVHFLRGGYTIRQGHNVLWYSHTHTNTDSQISVTISYNELFAKKNCPSDLGRTISSKQLRTLPCPPSTM